MKRFLIAVSIGIAAGTAFAQTAMKTGKHAAAPAHVTFTTLPTSVTEGGVLWCSDCSSTNPCTGSGTGARAQGTAGAWVCGTTAIATCVHEGGVCTTGVTDVPGGCCFNTGSEGTICLGGACGFAG